MEEEGCLAVLNTTADVSQRTGGALRFLLKGGCTVFVLATETMAVLAAWGLASPNPTNPGNMQSGSTTSLLGPSRQMPLNQTHGKSLPAFGTQGRIWVVHRWVVSGESTGEEPHASGSCDSEMQPRG